MLNRLCDRKAKRNKINPPDNSNLRTTSFFPLFFVVLDLLEISWIPGSGRYAVVEENMDCTLFIKTLRNVPCQNSSNKLIKIWSTMFNRFSSSEKQFAYLCVCSRTLMPSVSERWHWICISAMNIWMSSRGFEHQDKFLQQLGDFGKWSLN